MIEWIVGQHLCVSCGECWESVRKVKCLLSHSTTENRFNLYMPWSFIVDNLGPINITMVLDTMYHSYFFIIQSNVIKLKAIVSFLVLCGKSMNVYHWPQPWVGYKLIVWKTFCYEIVQCDSYINVCFKKQKNKNLSMKVHAVRMHKQFIRKCMNKTVWIQLKPPIGQNVK